MKRSQVNKAANDDLNDNFFINEEVGGFSEVDEHDPATVNLISD